MSFYRNLFPPMLSYNLPAFDGTSTTKVYFNLSIGNDRSQVKHAQVMINKLIDNKNALNPQIYPLGLIFYKDNEILYDEQKMMYYVTLPANLLPLNNDYRLQMRLGKQNINGITLTTQWLNDPNNIKDFSEWSNVCIIKPITAPQFDLVNFVAGAEPSTQQKNEVNIVNSNTFQFIGQYSSNVESLKSYKMELYDINNTLLSSSEEKTSYPISHTFDYNLFNNTYYYIKFIIKTINGYIGEKVYKVYTQFTPMPITLNMSITPLKDYAKIRINIQGTNQPDSTIIDRIYIRRTSSKSNFQKWEDVAVFLLSTQERIGSFNKTYDDVFVESGIVYRYAVQGANVTMRGTISSTQDVILDYEHCWLIENDEKQIMLGYNAQISNYQYIVKENVVETLGRYPHILRNGQTKYRQLQFNATLTAFGDLDKKYSYQIDLFDNNTINTYNNFFRNNDLDKDYNYIFEREFREKILDMLYNGKPKVFKSDTEGLMLVQLTNISLQPKNEIGKIVYDFSCTMTEIGEVDFQTLQELGIKKGV